MAGAAGYAEQHARRLLRVLQSQYLDECSRAAAELRASLQLGPTMQALLLQNSAPASEDVGARLARVLAAHTASSEAQLYERWMGNAEVLARVLELAAGAAADVELKYDPKWASAFEPAAYDTGVLVLQHLSRDWTEPGCAAGSRMSELACGALCALLRARAADPAAPAGAGAAVRVLVVGCGTGRLLLELGQASLAWPDALVLVEGCDVSLALVTAARTMLLDATATDVATRTALDRCAIAPWLHQAASGFAQASDRMRLVQLRLSPVPQSDAAPAAPASHADGQALRARLRLVWADFMIEYAQAHQAASVHLLVTHYTLDALVDPIAAMALIARLLAPGGQWLNCGPAKKHGTRPMPALSVLLELAPLFDLRVCCVQTISDAEPYFPCAGTVREYYAPVTWLLQRN